MRKLSITPNKKQQSNGNSQLTHLINSLFLSNLTNSTPSSVIAAHSKYRVSKPNNNEPSQINLEQNGYPLITSKNLLPRNNKDSYSVLKNHESIRPKTSIPSNTNRNEKVNQNNKRGLSSGYNNRNRNFENATEAKQGSQKKQEIQIQYTLGEPESMILKGGNKPSKSIISTKPIGIVQGYAVNSHKFYVHPSQSSEARICIIGNMTKITAKQRIISFYSIFENTGSTAYLDFLRQHFSMQISQYLNNVPIPPITSSLIDQTLKSVQRKFVQCYKAASNRPSSLSPSKMIKNRYNHNKDISFAMAFIRNHDLTICLKGDCYAIFSSNFGKKINKLTFSSLAEINGNSPIQLKTFQKQETKQFDFMTLASNGVYNCNIVSSGSHYDSNLNGSPQVLLNKSSGWLHRQIWLNIISQMTKISQEMLTSGNRQQMQKFNVHDLLGATLDSIMNLFLNCLISQNISLLVLGFDNIQKLLENEQEDEWASRQVQRKYQSNKRLSEPQKTTAQSYPILNNLEIPYRDSNMLPKKASDSSIEPKNSQTNKQQELTIQHQKQTS